MIVRNFIYLDSAKLRSLSSQIFEGVTDAIIQTEQSEKSDKEEQKGPLNSGKLLADIYTQSQSSSQMRFLEDHAYSIFEKKVLSDNIALEYSDDVSSETIGDFPLVLVTGTLKFNDMAAIENIVGRFNDYGSALFRVINNEEAVTRKWGAAEIKSRAMQSNLIQDKNFLDALKEVVHFGYSGVAEAEIQCGSHNFSAPLKRESLREKEQFIVHKYSRRSQITFKMLGIVTQIGGGARSEVPDVKDQDGIKNALRVLIDHMAEVEGTFSRPGSSEIILDPLAIYSEISKS
jgi:hypothetical protein